MDELKRAMQEGIRERAREALALARVLRPLVAKKVQQEARRVRDELMEAYDGEPGGILYGTPQEARAWRALRDDGDVAHFLRIFDLAGDNALLEQLEGLAPLEVFRAEVAWRDHRRMTKEEMKHGLAGAPGERESPCFDWMSLAELHRWRETFVGAYRTMAEIQHEWAHQTDMAALARGGEPADDPKIRALRDLEPADLLLLAAAERNPRGVANRDAAVYQRIQTLRRRVQRRAEKFSESVSE